MYRRPPTYQPPSLLPISLIQRFDRIAAQLQSTLLKHFLLLHATAQKRPTPTISPRHLPIPSSSPPPLQPPRSSQRRLTDIWRQLPPPYIADRPTPAAVACCAHQTTTTHRVLLLHSRSTINSPTSDCCSTRSYSCTDSPADTKPARSANLAPPPHACAHSITYRHSRSHHQLPIVCTRRMWPSTLPITHLIMILISSRLRTSCMQMCVSV